MADNAEEQTARALSWLKWRRRFHLLVSVFISLCFATSAILLCLIVALRFTSCTDQSSCRLSRKNLKIYGGATVLLFLLGGMTMFWFVYHKKRRHTSVPLQLPVEQFVEASLRQNSNEVEANVRDLDLPDYFAAVKYEKDVAGHVSLPPSYEQVLKMTASIASVSEVDTYCKQGNSENTT